MRHAARLILLLTAILPLCAGADIKSDMADPYMSPARVIQNAMAEGIPIGDIVDEMIRIDRGQATAVIDAALRLEPDELQMIVAAAVNAGVDPGDVVKAALAATDEARAEEVIDAVAYASPPSGRRNIAEAVKEGIPGSGESIKDLAVSRVYVGQVGDREIDTLGTVRVNVTAQTSAQAMDFGKVKVIPDFRLSAIHDDNIYKTTSDAVGSFVTSAGMSLQVLGDLGTGTGALTYEGDFASYQEDSRDDYDDHLIAGEYISETRFADFRVTAAMKRDHDERGERASAGIPLTRTEPDQWEVKGFSAAGDIGKENALGLGFDIGKAKLEYTNNRTLTAHLDREIGHAYGRIYLRVSPSIRFFGEYGKERFIYDTAQAGTTIRDSDEESVGGGISWRYGSKTRGELKIASREKDFDDATRALYKMVAWEATFVWSPSSNTRFAVTTSREPRETYRNGDFVEARDLAVGMAYQLNDRFGWRYYSRYAQDNYVAAVRNDKIGEFEVSVTYHMRRFAGLRFFYDRTSRDSTVDLYDYVSNTVGVAVDLSL